MIAEAEIEMPAVTELAGHELKTLARQSSHYLAGLMGNMALGLVAFPIFTRVFSVSTYGTIDLAQKVVLLLTVVSKGGLQNAALRFYDKEQFARNWALARGYYSTMFFGVLATSTAVTVLFVAVSQFAPASVTGGPLGVLIYVMAVLVMLRALGSILWAFLRIEERTKIFNVASVGTRATTIAAVCALLPLAGRSPMAYFTGVVLAESALVAWLTVWLLKRGALAPGCLDVAQCRAGMAFGMPLVLYEFGFVMLGSADRFLVRLYLGPDALGVYSVAYGLAQHANEVLLAPLVLALTPIYLRLWNSAGAQKTTDFLSVSLDLFLLAAAGILATAACSAQPLVVLLASSKYAGAGRLIPLLLAGLLVYALHIFVAAGLFIHKRSLQMTAILALAAVFNIGLNCLLLPRAGLIGGAWATLLSYGFCVFWLARASIRLLPLHIKMGPLTKYGAAGILAWMAGSRIEFSSPILHLFATSTLTVGVYCVALYALDARVRHAVRWAAVRIHNCL